jgi:hypothetical protein
MIFFLTYSSNLLMSSLEKMPMRWGDVLRVSRLPLPERKFMLLGVAVIIVTRLMVILATPRTADFLDPRIYQGAGQTVLEGVNPYDYSDHPALRARLRADMAAGHGADDFTRTQKSWDYYVSGNPPASTALYALFETLSRGSRFGWRLLFILGDISLFLGLVGLVKALRGRVEDAVDQAGIACLAIINPVLIVAGCAIPEEKQFQTALMLWSAALLLSPAAATARRAVGVGFALSLSVLFKLLGIFLVPLWFARVKKEGLSFAAWSALGGLLPVAAAFAAFGHHFLNAMTARGVQNSVGGAEHASPWVLVPWLEGTEYIVVKAAVFSLFCATLGALLIKRRIDLLNFCAGLTVAFVCLWLDKGAMNRMNIAIVFAVAALSSLSSRLFLGFSAAIVLASAVGYALGVGVLRFHLELVDAALALMFLTAYVAALVGRANAWKAGGPMSTGP